MFTGIYQSAALLLIIALFYITDFFLIAHYDHRRKAAGSGRSWDYTALLVITAVVLVIQPALLPGLSVTTAARWAALVQGIGLLLALSALALHWWARACLREFYAERVELQPEHRIIQSGPYAVVRHPVFTSFFMIVTGLLLINPALPTLLVAVYAVLDFTRAARQEERLLSENLPGYKEYMARTTAFFPRLGGFKRG